MRDTLPAWGIDPADVRGIQLVGERVCRFSLVDGRRLILKRAWERLDEARLAADARLLAHLHACDVPVAVPLATQDGSCFVARGEHRYTLSPVLPVGGKLVAESVVSRNVGRAIARLHRALAVYPHVIDSWTYDLPSRVLDECVSRCRAYLGRVCQDRFEAALSEFLPCAASMLSLGQVQRLHGDCHGGNVLIHNGAVSGFVDIDHLPLGPRLYDVGYYLADRAKNSFGQTEMRQGWLDTLVGVLSGYAEESPWTRAELSAVWHVMVGAQMLFIEVFSMQGNDGQLSHNLATFEWLVSQQDGVTRVIQEAFPNSYTVKRSARGEKG